jgi:hypothetical protein
MTRQAIWVVTVLVFAALASASPAAAAQCDTSWNAAVSGDWNTSGNWTSGIPTSGINACITVAGTYTVAVTDTAAIAKGLTLGGGASGIQTLRLASAGSSHVKLTLQNQGSDSSAGILGNGVLKLDTDHNAFNIWLDVFGGTLVNAGTIQSLTGAGGAGGRNLTGNLDNQGTLTVDETLTGGGGVSVWTSSGTITVASLKSLSLSFTSGSFTQTAGTITNNGTFSVSGGSVSQSGGTATAGNAIQVFTTTFSPSAGSGNFDLSGTNTLGSDIGAGHNVTILAGLGGAHAQLNVVNRTNSGTLVLNALNASFTSTLDATGGTLTNAGTIQVVTGAGGGRAINGTISSSGTIDLDESVPIASGSWTSTGTIDVASGKTLTIAFGASVSQSGAGSTT